MADVAIEHRSLGPEKACWRAPSVGRARFVTDFAGRLYQKNREPPPSPVLSTAQRLRTNVNTPARVRQVERASSFAALTDILKARAATRLREISVWQALRVPVLVVVVHGLIGVPVVMALERWLDRLRCG